MTLNKPKVVVTRRLPEVIEGRMRELFNVTLNEADTPLSRTDLAAAMAGADVLVPTVTDRIDAELIKGAGEQLKLIASFGTGVDHVDVEAATARGITVTNTPGVLTEDTADMTMALILAVPRRLLEGAQKIKDGHWKGWAPTWMLGHRINGKKLGIVGMGRIGQAVAQRARAFGMEIHYHNRKQLPLPIEDRFEATYWPKLDDMLAAVDVVTVHCPHTPATYHLLSGERLAKLPPEAYVVNTARGEIVEEAALISMLENGTLAGAALDVFEHEPAVNPKLLDMPNVILLPHMSSATIEGRIAMGERVLINIKTFVDGHRPPDRVLGEGEG